MHTSLEYDSNPLFNHQRLLSFFLICILFRSNSITENVKLQQTPVALQVESKFERRACTTFTLRFRDPIRIF